MPCRGESGAAGVRDIPVEFAGIVFSPGDWLRADRDGLVLGDAALAQEVLA